MASTPISFTARDVVTAALQDLSVIAEGNAAASSFEMQQGFTYLNRLVMQLRLQEFTVPFIARQVFDIVSLQASYTIGPLGDFVTQRPQQIDGCGLLLNPTDDTTATEIPVPMLTDNAYQQIRVKGMQNTQFTQAYYNPTYTDGLGQLWLWPTPTTDVNAIVLYLAQYIDTFADLSTTYSFPPGYFDLFEYGLARRLLIPYGIRGDDVTSGLREQFALASALVKRQNIKRNDMPQDTGSLGGYSGVYNILTDAR